MSARACVCASVCELVCASERATDRRRFFTRPRAPSAPRRRRAQRLPSAVSSRRRRRGALFGRPPSVAGHHSGTGLCARHTPPSAIIRRRHHITHSRRHSSAGHRLTLSTARATDFSSPSFFAHFTQSHSLTLSVRLCGTVFHWSLLPRHC